LNGNSFTENKPKDCRNCYFWRNNRVGCELGKENCYYRKVEKTEASECDDCPYGRASPCIEESFREKERHRYGKEVVTVSNV